MEKLWFDYNFNDLTEIIKMPDNRGLDFRFQNYPYDDISVECTKWKTIQDFLEWYTNQNIHESVKE